MPQRPREPAIEAAMGTLVGHVAPGVFFLLMGLWHLFAHTRLFLTRPSSYTAPIWFPVKHQPLDDDGTIPSAHLHNFEHASISLAWLVFAAATIHMDRARTPMRDAVAQLAAAAAFAQQLIVFHFHSGNHAGVPGQFHSLLQMVIAVSLAATLLRVAYPRSFVVSLVRAASLVFMGVWFIVMGVMMWTPALVPKGCFLNVEEGLEVVRCRTDGALDRAKSLINLQFSWYLTGTVLFVVVFYLQMSKLYYSEEPRYASLEKGSSDSRFISIGNEDEDDLEVAKGLGRVL